jgi:hypothetical protein
VQLQCKKHRVEVPVLDGANADRGQAGEGSLGNEALDRLDIPADGNHPHDAGHAWLRRKEIMPSDSGYLGP